LAMRGVGEKRYKCTRHDHGQGQRLRTGLRQAEHRSQNGHHQHRAANPENTARQARNHAYQRKPSFMEVLNSAARFLGLVRLAGTTASIKLKHRDAQYENGINPTQEHRINTKRNLRSYPGKNDGPGRPGPRRTEIDFRLLVVLAYRHEYGWQHHDKRCALSSL